MRFEVVRSQFAARVNISAFGEKLKSCRHGDYEHTWIEWSLFGALIVLAISSVFAALWYKAICSRIHHLRVAMEVFPSEAQLYEAATMEEPQEQPPAANGVAEEGLDIGERPARTADQD